MPKPASIFLSYAREDRDVARKLEKALIGIGASVWKDDRSIAGGAVWFSAIEEGIRDSRGVVVVISNKSADSDWVLYEYAFARGADRPRVAVRLDDARIPGPLSAFQHIPFENPKRAAKQIDAAFLSQAKASGQERVATPKLVAKFQEDENGEVIAATKGTTPSLCMELWVEGAPPTTQSVRFEIPDQEVEDNPWTVNRTIKGWDPDREFLTKDEFNLYGDVEIWARGSLPSKKSWSTNTTLYEALERYYRNHPKTAAIRRALKQIKTN